MEENKKELNAEELEQVIGGAQVFNIYDRSPIYCFCGCDDWICHGWRDNPSGYRLECSSCHDRTIFDGMHWVGKW